MNDRLHVGIFSPALAGGGAERVTVRVAAGLANEGLRVDLVLATAKGPYLAEVPDNVNIVDLGRSRTITSLPALAKYLRRGKPDAVFSSLLRAHVVLLWARRLAGSNARVVIRQPNMLNPAGETGKSFKDHLVKRLAVSACRRADAIVATSQRMVDELLDITKVAERKITIIPNPLPIADIQHKAQQPIEAPWLEKGQPPVILSVGRLTAQKDFPTLIHAFAKLRQTRDARLIILGEGELRGELETLVDYLGLSADVSLPGFADNPYAYMQRAPVFVLPSLWEGFPNVLVEAMACGAPVVATVCPGGSAEILENGKWGQLVPVGDSQALAKAIAQTLNQQSAPDILARAQAFSANRVMQRYLTLFQGG